MQFLFLLLSVIAARLITADAVNKVNVGFDFKLSYGTAAASSENGTLIGVVRVNTTESYRDTFKKLSLSSSTHYAPPYYSSQEYWEDLGRQCKRKARKAAGKPASDDVAAISTLIKSLREEIERAMGIRVNSAAASVPRLVALYDEDLYDAFEYVGLEYLQIMSVTAHRSFLTYETSAALAGHNNSLCPNMTIPEECWNDESLSDNYLIVQYTEDSLFAYHSHTFKQGAYRLSDDCEFSLDLGSASRNKNPNEEFYWAAVRKVLLRPLMYHSSQRPSSVILVGDRARDAAFRRTLNSVLEEWYQGQALPKVVDDDPEFVQVRGVAEFARRRKFLPKPKKPKASIYSFSERGVFHKNQVPIS